MKFLSSIRKRKVLKLDNRLIDDGIRFRDRPTDLKNHFLETYTLDEDFLVEACESALLVENYSQIISIDIRLASLRSVCTDSPELFSFATIQMPELFDDERARMSITTFQKRALDVFLGKSHVSVVQSDEVLENIVEQIARGAW